MLNTLNKNPIPLIIKNTNQSLFGDVDFFQYKFPRPQYLGAKIDLLQFINENIPNDVNICLDAFAGSQSVAFFLKQKGYKVLTNDFLNANNQIGISLIENKNEKLTDKDIEILFTENKNKKNLMERLFKDLFFVKDECIMLDNYRANISKLKNKYKEALAISIMNRAMQRKIIMGHFAHTKAIDYANNPERVKRNRSISRPIKDLFLEILNDYNNAVFDNEKENKSFNENILELLPKLKNEKIDLLYLDPPYVDSHSDYQSFYHLLETFTEYWKDKDFINGTKRYSPPRVSNFDKKSEIVESLEKIFKLAKDIPYWLISWNDRSYPSVDDFEKIISKYKKVEVKRKVYNNSKGGKGSVSGSSEILFVCR